MVAVVVIVGLPTALMVAWYFEITPSGLVPTDQVPTEQSIAPQTGKRIDRVIIVFLLVALAFFVVDAVVSRVSQDERGESKSPAQGYNSLALLPELGPQPLLDQLVTEIAGVLSRLPAVVVTPMEVVESLKVRDPVEAVANALGVHYLLLFQPSPENDSQFQVDLYDALAKETVWTAAYGADFRDALTLQTEISQEVVQRLGVITHAEAQSLLSPPTEDAEAFAHYLRGQLLMSDDSVEDRLVEQEFRAAIATHPFDRQLFLTQCHNTFCVWFTYPWPSKVSTSSRGSQSWLWIVERASSVQTTYAASATNTSVHAASGVGQVSGTQSAALGSALREQRSFAGNVYLAPLRPS
ncbi:MAG: hypothetical protein PVH91_02510 [Pseudomonadales bacterium]